MEKVFVNSVRSGSPRFIIIGAGMSGLCMAIRLKQSGFDNVTVLESSDEVGGTWHKNTYPNAGCDIPSYLYCYSFAPNYDWSMKYARQPEILGYFRNCVERFSLRPHLRFRTAVRAARFDEDTATWQVTTDAGDTLTAEFLISAVGQLNRPNIPAIAGIESFSGASLHSARWNHDYDLTDKTVAVIGNGASAIQFIPEVARQAGRTLVFQRTPSWIHPLHNSRYPRWARWMFRTVPLCAGAHRFWIYLMCDMRVFAFRSGSKLNLEYARWLRSRMRKLIPPEQWSTLIPDYAPGCKRVLLSSDYLQTLQRDDVDVISDHVDRFDIEAVWTSNQRYPIDAAIFATGFQANDFLQPLDIRGRNGQSLDDAWAGRPKAYGGIAVAGFPNLFLLYGPNTNLGHNSIIFMVERQVDYITKCLRRMQKSGARWIEVRQDAMESYDREIQQQLASSIWAGDCTSWYKAADGSIPNNWSGSATAFWRRMRNISESDFELSR